MDYYIYLKAEPYLADFLHHCFGNPVQLERDSPESRIIRQYITKTPQGQTPDLGKEANLSVVLPVFKEADPRVYNYLGKQAQKTLLESFDQVFEMCLMKEVGALENYRRGTISSLIYAWMEKHGIEDNETNWYTISKKYYRMREKYVKNGIKL